MREMHRWGAHAMVITVWLHMFRVFMTGSTSRRASSTGSVGVILLVLTLLLSFTGYLLPWDQLAIWAITVGSNMARATPFLGHEGPGAQLLRARRRAADSRRPTMRGSRCSAGRSSAKARCCGSTCCTASGSRSASRVLMAVHFWRVRKDGGIQGRCENCQLVEAQVQRRSQP